MIALPTLTKAQRIRRGLEPGWTPVSHWSLTDYLSEYGGCPAFYKRIHIDGEKEPSNPAADFGIWFHKDIQAAIERVARPRYDGPLTFVTEYAELRERFDEEIRPQLRPGGKCEQEFLYDWQDGEQRVQLKARLDYIVVEGERAFIDEFKTGRKVTARDDIGQDFQGRIQDLVVKRTMPWIKETVFRLWPIRFGANPRVFVFTDHTDPFEEMLRDRVGVIIRDQEFKHNPGSKLCPAGEHASFGPPTMIRFTNGTDLEIHEPTSDDEATQLATALKVIQQMETALVAALRPWTERERKPAAVMGDGGYYYDFGRNERECLDMPQAIEILKARFGDDWMAYIRLNLTTLKPYLDSKKKVIPALKDLMKTTRSPYWSWRATAPEGKGPVESASSGAALALSAPTPDGGAA